MALRNLIKEVLTSTSLVELTQEKIEGVVKDIADTLAWCFYRYDLNACTKFMGIVSEFIENFTRVRIRKYVALSRDELAKVRAIDKDILSYVKHVVKLYYTLLALGLIEDDKVPVRIKREFTLNSRKYSRGAVTLVNTVEALLLSKLGIAELVPRIPINLISLSLVTYMPRDTT